MSDRPGHGRDRLPLFRVLDLACRDPNSPWSGVERMVATVIVNHGSPATVRVATIVRESGFCRRAVKKALRTLTVTGKEGSPPLFDVLETSRRKARTYNLREGADCHSLQRVPIVTHSGAREGADVHQREGADRHSETVLIGTLHKRTEAPLEAPTEKRREGEAADEPDSRPSPVDTDYDHRNDSDRERLERERLAAEIVGEAMAIARKARGWTVTRIIEQASRIPAGNGHPEKCFRDPRAIGISIPWLEATQRAMSEVRAQILRPIPL